MTAEIQTLTETLRAHDIIAGRYEVLELIAEGGMGSIYLGKQIELDRQVAIKTLLPRHSKRTDLIARFRREARAAQRLTHPNTVRVYDFGETEGELLYLVMEYLKGRTLDVVLNSMAKMPASVVIHIGRQVLKSLVEAHAHGIVHRDIKPSNLMLCRQLGELNLVKVLDFGLARIIQTTEGATPTAGSTMGTPHFMSPEQVSFKPLDGRSDLYSLGLTLFELATGQHAYDGESAYEVAMCHISPDPLALPKELVGTRLGTVIERAVRKDPEKRYQSAEEMLTALSGVDPTKTDEAMAVLDLLHSTDLLPVYPSQGMSGAQDGLATENLTRLAIQLDGQKRRRVYLAFALLVAVVAAVVLFDPRISLHSGAADASSIDELSQLNSPPQIESEPLVVATAPSDPQPQGEPEVAEIINEVTEVAAIDASPGIRLVVLSDPSGAAVFLDGVSVCKTPCDRIEQIRSEPSSLVLVIDGYQPTEQQLVLSENVYHTVTLVPIPEPSPPRTERSHRRRDSNDDREVDTEPTAETAEAQQESPPAVESDDPEQSPTRRRALPIDF